MNKEIQLKVTNDYIFKKIFAKKGNESLLKDLLNSILQIKINSIEVLADTNLERQLESNKMGILDIKAKVDEDTIIDIEIQTMDGTVYLFVLQDTLCAVSIREYG